MILHRTIIQLLCIRPIWIFQTIHALVSCLGACAGFVTTDIVCWRGDWIKIVSDQMVEQSVHGVGSRGPLKPLGGVQGRPRQGSRSGSRGKGPLEAPGFLGVLRPQNASPRIIFFFHFSDKFCAKSVDHVDIWYKKTRAHLFSSDRPTGR